MTPRMEIIVPKIPSRSITYTTNAYVSFRSCSPRSQLSREASRTSLTSMDVPPFFLTHVNARYIMLSSYRLHAAETCAVEGVEPAFAMRSRLSSSGSISAQSRMAWLAPLPLPSHLVSPCHWSRNSLLPYTYRLGCIAWMPSPINHTRGWPNAASASPWTQALCRHRFERLIACSTLRRYDLPSIFVVGTYQEHRAAG
jgi:hypothetical protein